MVLHDVAQGAGFFVEGAAAFDADAFRRGDLDVVDEVAVPDGLEDAVGKAKDQHVLHGFLAEVVIDAEDLVLAEDGVDVVVQFFGAFKVVAEGLFNDDANGADFRLRHVVRAETMNDVGEVVGRGGEIKEPIAAGAVVAIELAQQFLQRVVALIVVEVHRVVGDLLYKFIELAVVFVDTAELDDALTHIFGEAVGEIAAGDADDAKLFGEQAGLLQMKERGEQLALGQIAGGAEDDSDAGFGDVLLDLGRGLPDILGRDSDFGGCHRCAPFGDERRRC